MDKPSDSGKGDPSVKGVMERLLIDLNELPDEQRTVALDEQPKDDVAPPPHFYIDLCFRIEEQYKVLGSPSVAGSAHLKKLGFDNGCVTFMCMRDKKVKYPCKSLYALGRSWFKEGFTEKDQTHDVDCIISFHEGDKEKEKRNEDADTLAAKKLLQDFVKQAKTRARIAKEKGKKVQKKVPPAPPKVQKKVRFASISAPLRGKGIRKKKFVPKMRKLSDIMASIKKQANA